MDKFSYAMGMGIGQNLLSMGTKDLNIDDFAQAIKDIFAHRKTPLTFTEAQDIVNSYFSNMEAKLNEERIRKGKAFLEENRKRTEIVTLPSGLQYEILREGNGKKPTVTDRVKCHYEGTLIDGTVFDSSVQRGVPAVFGVSQVIKGWTQALQLMNEGSKWRLYIPADLAYGAQQAGELIPPYSTLIFDIELIQII